MVQRAKAIRERGKPIRVREATRKRLQLAGRMGETYDDVINRALNALSVLEGKRRGA